MTVRAAKPANRTFSFRSPDRLRFFLRRLHWTARQWVAGRAKLLKKDQPRMDTDQKKDLSV